MTKYDRTHKTPTEHADQRIFPLAESGLDNFHMLLDQPVDTEKLHKFLQAPTIFGTKIVLD